jgi:hypothetical protein
MINIPNCIESGRGVVSLTGTFMQSVYATAALSRSAAPPSRRPSRLASTRRNCRTGSGPCRLRVAAMHRVAVDMRAAALPTALSSRAQTCLHPTNCDRTASLNAPENDCGHTSASRAWGDVSSTIGRRDNRTRHQAGPCTQGNGVASTWSKRRVLLNAITSVFRANVQDTPAGYVVGRIPTGSPGTVVSIFGGVARSRNRSPCGGDKCYVRKKHQRAIVCGTAAGAADSWTAFSATLNHCGNHMQTVRHRGTCVRVNDGAVSHGLVLTDVSLSYSGAENDYHHSLGNLTGSRRQCSRIVQCNRLSGQHVG